VLFGSWGSSPFFGSPGVIGGTDEGWDSSVSDIIQSDHVDWNLTISTEQTTKARARIDSRYNKRRPAHVVDDLGDRAKEKVSIALY
jgi:hypothetical protein